MSRRGRRIGLSRSVTSHALSRLGDIRKDPLFVRPAAGLVPTHVLKLAGRLAEVLGADERALFAPPVFEPATAQASFDERPSWSIAMMVRGERFSHMQRFANRRGS